MIHDAKRWDAVHKKLYREDEWHSKYAEDKEKLFPRSSVIVDLGGGTGADALYFLKKGHSVVLLDISEFALRVSQEKAKKQDMIERLVVRQVDFGLHDLPVKDDSVDVVYSRIGLNYFPEDRTVKIFGDIYRILKPEGKAYLAFKSPDDVNEMEYLQKTAVEYEPGVYIQNGQLRSRFTKEQLEQLFRQAKIANFSVSPYSEKLEADDHYQQLFLNDSLITKKA